MVDCTCTVEGCPGAVELKYLDREEPVRLCGDFGLKNPAGCAAVAEQPVALQILHELRAIRRLLESPTNEILRTVAEAGSRAVQSESPQWPAL